MEHSRCKDPHFFFRKEKKTLAQLILFVPGTVIILLNDNVVKLTIL